MQAELARERSASRTWVHIGLQAGHIGLQAELERERSASRTWVHAALPGSTGTCPGTGLQGWALRVAGLDTWGCRLGAHGVAGWVHTWGCRRGGWLGGHLPLVAEAHL